ncbi:uncharacterized protein LOC141907438 [Tubulanus polymorphus]|uniref:uncharacterized protein LOC141907438 n=1 Tax=Tubulanus polymorphus TaxID=672921 RepID=UPI003DA240D8
MMIDAFISTLIRLFILIETVDCAWSTYELKINPETVNVGDTVSFTCGSIDIAKTKEVNFIQKNGTIKITCNNEDVTSGSSVDEESIDCNETGVSDQTPSRVDIIEGTDENKTGRSNVILTIFGVNGNYAFDKWICEGKNDDGDAVGISREKKLTVNDDSANANQPIVHGEETNSVNTTAIMTTVATTGDTTELTSTAPHDAVSGSTQHKKSVGTTATTTSATTTIGGTMKDGDRRFSNSVTGAIIAGVLCCCLMAIAVGCFFTRKRKKQDGKMLNDKPTNAEKKESRLVSIEVDPDSPAEKECSELNVQINDEGAIYADFVSVRAPEPDSAQQQRPEIIIGADVEPAVYGEIDFDRIGPSIADLEEKKLQT